jgi:RNA polymerase sigma-70 factor (ECF subfamily)
MSSSSEPGCPGRATEIRADLDRVMPEVYAQLRKLAGLYMSGERPDHTLQPTALVHEAYLRLADQADLRWTSPSHLLALAARTMRRVLVDHAAGHNADKRAGGRVRVPITDLMEMPDGAARDLIDVDRALEALSGFDARKGAIVEMRFFGGLTMDEIAEVLGISPATVHREWLAARLWLLRLLDEPVPR